MQQATNTKNVIGATRVSRAHNNPANYFGNTNVASIFSAIIRTSARTVRASTEATGPSFSPGRRRRRMHTQARGRLCGCACGRWRPRDGVGVGQDSFENLADMLSAAASVLGDTHYGLTRLKSIKFDHSSILSIFVSVLEINHKKK